jgi:hypothetical protein
MVFPILDTKIGIHQPVQQKLTRILLIFHPFGSTVLLLLYTFPIPKSIAICHLNISLPAERNLLIAPDNYARIQ